jgi:hypothetical protein
MNRNMTQPAAGPLASIGRRIAAFVAECNYAQTRMLTVQDAQKHI